MTLIPHRVANGVAALAPVLLAACAQPPYVTVPAGTTPLAHDEVMTLISSATVRRYFPESEANMTTKEDGSVEYFYKPGKAHFAHEGKILHAQGTWTVGQDGRFCVSLTWQSTASTHWCRFIFQTGTGYGASDNTAATNLENWGISKK
ncbi:DUF995 domain-containing protein [Paraburkholderia sediminicola]|uniref:DUF995 domain-containing protein n=1 Tax=Paraburkholderia sediminicola TaxID=458836 RepID=UPI0038B6E65F